MKSLDHDARGRLLQQCAAGELYPPIAVPLEAKRAERVLLRMKPAR